MTDATNKIAVVTGAGTGVGRAASLALMNAGFTVVLAGRRKEMLEETSKLGDNIGKSLPVVADMTRPDSIAALFQNRWTILTPSESTDPAYLAAVDKLEAFWTALGARVDRMDEQHHDLVLAVTSHLPHLIAYNIVGTAADLEEVTQAEVMKYSAGGFRDFTRIAASDPVMWRDIFLNNREAVLEIVQRFTEDLTALQRAIRWGEGDKLQELFTRTRAIRRSIIEAKQA